MSTFSCKDILATTPGWDALALRLVAGVIFIAHGAQKLFGWFGGGGLEGTGQWMASIGLEPGYLMALLAGGGEFFGGVLLVVGLLTRPAALICAFTMVVAIVVVHLDNGFFARSGGYEFSLALLSMSIALAVRGAGSGSVDQKLAQRCD